MHQSIILSELFKTSDLNLATSVYSMGYPIESIDKSGPNTIFFFKRDDQLDSIIQQYFNNQLLLSPLLFANNLKNLKSRIYHS